MTAESFGPTVGNNQHRLLKQDFTFIIFPMKVGKSFLTSRCRTGQINFLALIGR